MAFRGAGGGGRGGLPVSGANSAPLGGGPRFGGQPPPQMGRPPLRSDLGPNYGRPSGPPRQAAYRGSPQMYGCPQQPQVDPYQEYWQQQQRQQQMAAQYSQQSPATASQYPGWPQTAAPVNQAMTATQQQFQMYQQQLLQQYQQQYAQQQQQKIADAVQASVTSPATALGPDYSQMTSLQAQAAQYATAQQQQQLHQMYYGQQGQHSNLAVALAQLQWQQQQQQQQQQLLQQQAIAAAAAKVATQPQSTTAQNQASALLASNWLASIQSHQAQTPGAATAVPQPVPPPPSLDVAALYAASIPAQVTQPATVAQPPPPPPPPPSEPQVMKSAAEQPQSLDRIRLLQAQQKQIEQMLASFDQTLREQFSGSLPTEWQHQRNQLISRLDTLNNQVWTMQSQSVMRPISEVINLSPDDRTSLVKKALPINAANSTIIVRRLFALRKQLQFIELLDELDDKYLDDDVRGDKIFLDKDEYDEEEEGDRYVRTVRKRDMSPEAHDEEDKNDHSRTSSERDSFVNACLNQMRSILPDQSYSNSYSQRQAYSGSQNSSTLAHCSRRPPL